MVELKSNEIKARMEKAIDSLKKDLSGLRVGRASSSMLDQISVNAYGSLMPINQVSTVSVPEPRLLLVNVWDSLSRCLLVFVNKVILYLLSET